MSLLNDPSFSDHISTVRARWDAALEATEYPATVVSAGANKNYFLDDQAPPYRANPHFAQWFPGRDTEHCELIITSDADPLVLFYQPRDFWHMPPSVPDWASANFSVEQHSTLESLATAREQHLKGINSIAVIGPDAPGATDGTHSHNPAALIDHLDFLRNQKTAFEVAAIREATRKSVAGHEAARTAFYAGGTEYEIYMQFLVATGNTAAELPYSSIVALNDHAGVLHYQHYDREAPDNHLSFLIDAGASHLGYASDITRTYSQKNQAPDEFSALIEALDRCQLELIDGITTGTAYADLHGNMINSIATVLCEHRILTCSPEEAINDRLADPFMPHGLGHLIGLQTHDVGGHLAGVEGTLSPPDERFPALRLTRKLETDSVFTIEPGIYFIPLLLDPLRGSKAPINWSLVDRLIPCGGIRIEDNVWLSDKGPVNLTREAFDAL